MQIQDIEIIHEKMKRHYKMPDLQGKSYIFKGGNYYV